MGIATTTASEKHPPPAPAPPPLGPDGVSGLSLSSTSPLRTSTSPSVPVRSHGRRSWARSSPSGTKAAAAAAEARAELRLKVREDWAYPCPASHAQFPHGPSTQYVDREADSSESGLEPVGPASARSPDPYRFDSPHAVGTSVGARKRKRRKLLHEEMAWNEGLRTFQDRRNAWTGALTQQGDATSPGCPTSEEDGHSERIPLPAPILPADHPVRASITPATYPAIYTRVVVQGTSPSVPINLSDITRAMVSGWKADGEWPPKVAELEPLAGRRRPKPAAVEVDSRGDKERGIVGKGMGRVKKVLGIGGDGRDGDAVGDVDALLGQ